MTRRRRALRARGWPGGMSTAPCIAKGKPDAAFEGDRHRAVVRAHLLPTEVFFESVDPGVFRYGFVPEEAAPVVALYSHLLELQHFSPVKPAIGAPDQGAVIVFLVSETGTRVLEPGGSAACEVGVPDQGLAVLRGGREDELAGFAGGKQPLAIAGPVRLLLGERVEERAEFIQPALRVGDELHAKPILRFSAPDLVTAILAEILRDRVCLRGKIGHHGEERGGSRIGDRSLSLAVQDDIHSGISMQFLVVPDLPVDSGPAPDADHSSPRHFSIDSPIRKPVPGEARCLVR